MGTGDGFIVGTTKIVDSGPPSDKYNLVLLAEGYRSSELNKFEEDCEKFVDHLFRTPPFNEYRCAFNIYRVKVASNESGANDPVGCGGTGASPATYFDATFCGNGVQRLLLVNDTTAVDVANAQVPEWHTILVIVNSDLSGGSGGTVATTSTQANWENIALHELGHAAFGLADEYEYWEGCFGLIDPWNNRYTGPEPAFPNITIESSRDTIKWKDLVQSSTPMPTTSNPNCMYCDTQPNPVSASTVGAFEGGGYHHCGIYRPQFDCMMRNISPFCAVCSRRIRQTLSPYVADCYASTFEGAGWLSCIILLLTYSVVIALLALFAWDAGVRCTIKQMLFRIQHCSDGNRERCREISV